MRNARKTKSDKISQRKKLSWHARKIGLHEIMQHAFLGQGGLRYFVAEMLSEDKPRTNWMTESVSDEQSGTVMSPLDRRSFPFPGTDHQVQIESLGDYLLLTMSLDSSRAECEESEAEFSIYCDGEGAGGRQALEAFSLLAAGVWPDNIAFPSGADSMYPRIGSGPCWEPNLPWGSAANLLPEVQHPYSQRFLRLPLAETLSHAKEPSRLQIKIRVGQDYVQEIAEALQGRLHLNHVVMWNRLIERIEPEVSRQEMPNLSGRSPILLECIDIHSGHQFVDSRFLPAGMDPCWSVKLKKLRHREQWKMSFHNEDVAPSDLRVAWLRHLDWSDLKVHPGKTKLLEGRAPRFLVKTSISPDADRGDDRQIREVLEAIPRRFVRDPWGTPPEKIARLTWSLMPTGMRRWLRTDSKRSRHHGLNIQTQVKEIPDNLRSSWQSKHAATLTHTVTLSLLPKIRPEGLLVYKNWLEKAVNQKLDPPGQLLRIELVAGEPS